MPNRLGPIERPKLGKLMPQTIWSLVRGQAVPLLYLYSLCLYMLSNRLLKSLLVGLPKFRFLIFSLF